MAVTRHFERISIARLTPIYRKYMLCVRINGVSVTHVFLLSNDQWLKFYLKEKQLANPHGMQNRSTETLQPRQTIRQNRIYRFKVVFELSWISSRCASLVVLFVHTIIVALKNGTALLSNSKCFFLHKLLLDFWISILFWIVM